MKNLPRPKFYTIEELAKEWDFEVSRVQSFVADGHLKWKDDDILLEDVLRIFATLEPEVDEKYLPPASYVISLEEIERFENEYDLAGPATKETPPIVTAPPPNIIGAQPKVKGKEKSPISSTTPITQAIEKMYRYYFDKKEYDLIRPKYVDAFILKMSDLVKAEDIPSEQDEKELKNYLAERIKTVSKDRRDWKITTQERHLPAKKQVKKIEESTIYKRITVSKSLCRLREKYKIPLTIPVP
ncbi:MAG: hypothetical protein FD168_1603 [Desulfobulbaceae bacterium]|nr:MAG: hypothetical protein FD168_1603 [Desulfobulbaceae bacterium]